MLLTSQIVGKFEILFYWQNIPIFDRNDIFLQYHNKMRVMTTSEKILNYATMQGGPPECLNAAGAADIL